MDVCRHSGSRWKQWIRTAPFSLGASPSKPTGWPSISAAQANGSFRSRRPSPRCHMPPEIAAPEALVSGEHAPAAKRDLTPPRPDTCGNSTAAVVLRILLCASRRLMAVFLSALATPIEPFSSTPSFRTIPIRRDASRKGIRLGRVVSSGRAANRAGGFSQERLLSATGIDIEAERGNRGRADHHGPAVDYMVEPGRRDVSDSPEPTEPHGGSTPCCWRDSISS